MIERYRPPRVLQEASPSAPAPPPRAKSSTPEFVLIPRELLARPPIRHRGADEETGLSVFEFAIAAAIIGLARKTRRASGHKYALRSGKRAMDARRRRQYPVRDTYVLSADQQFAAEGSAGYDEGLAKFNEESADDDVSITTTRSELLRLAGLSRKTEN